MIEYFKAFLKQTIVFGLSFYLVHQAIVSFAFSELELPYPLVAIYASQFFISGITCVVLVKISESKKDLVGYSFLGLSLLRGGLTYLIMLPVKQSYEVFPKELLVQFLIPYFVFLALDAWYTTYLLKD